MDISLTAIAQSLRGIVVGTLAKEVLQERLLLAAEKLEFADRLLSAERSELLVANERISELLAEIEECHLENAAQKIEIDDLRSRLQPDPFVERNGLFYKRMPNGDWCQDAFCPTCRKPIAFIPGRKVHCAACGFTRSYGRHTHIANLNTLAGS